MIPNTLLPHLTALPGRLRGVFNLNDGRWGRGGGDDKPAEAPASDSEPPRQQGGGGRGPNPGPPDLDELWRDFNRKLGGLFGGKKGGNWGGAPRGGNSGGGGNGGGGGFQPPSFKGASIGGGVILAVALLIWLATGFFIVQEGQQAAILRFGKFLGPEKGLVGAGFRWRLPYPFERHEIVRVSQLRSVEVGRNSVVQNTGMRDTSMLTEDENIVDIRFVVQFRVKDPAEYLFTTVQPEQAVVMAAESAVREVVGKAAMNVVLYERREAIASDVIQSTQRQLDLYKTGILVSSVNIQNVQPPEQVQAAFDDAIKAGQDRDRAKNEGQAYANEVIPRAEGTAARLRQEAEGYKARVIAQAEGDAQRFRAIYAEYQKAPQVTRDRMYTDTMQQIYAGVTKILVDTKSNNLLSLPLDRLLQAGALPALAASQDAPSASGSGASSMVPPAPAVPGARDSRSRERDGR